MQFTPANYVFHRILFFFRCLLYEIDHFIFLLRVLCLVLSSFLFSMLAWRMNVSIKYAFAFVLVSCVVRLWFFPVRFYVSIQYKMENRSVYGIKILYCLTISFVDYFLKHKVSWCFVHVFEFMCACEYDEFLLF